MKLTDSNWSENIKIGLGNSEKVSCRVTYKNSMFFVARGEFVHRSSEARILDQCVILTIKHCSDLVIIWGCFNSETFRDLVKIEGILKNAWYQKY